MITGCEGKTLYDYDRAFDHRAISINHVLMKASAFQNHTFCFATQNVLLSMIIKRLLLLQPNYMKRSVTIVISLSWLIIKLCRQFQYQEGNLLEKLRKCVNCSTDS